MVRSEVWYVRSTFGSMVRLEVWYVRKYGTFGGMVRSEVWNVRKYGTFGSMVRSEVWYVRKYGTFGSIVQRFCAEVLLRKYVAIVMLKESTVPNAMVDCYSTDTQTTEVFSLPQVACDCSLS